MGYKRLQGVFSGEKEYEVTRGLTAFKRLQGGTRGYRRFKGVTTNYKGLQRVLRGFRRLQGVTRGYK